MPNIFYLTSRRLNRLQTLRIPLIWHLWTSPSAKLPLGYAAVLLFVKQFWHYQTIELDSVTCRVNLTTGTRACDILQNNTVIKETPMWCSYNYVQLI